MPDFFHVVHEIIKSYALALGRHLRHAPQELKAATETLARLQGLPRAAHDAPQAKALVAARHAEVTSSPWLKPGVSHPWGEHQMLCLLRRHLLTSPWLKPGASRRTW